MISKLEKNFGEYICGLARYNTPGPPGEGIVRPESMDQLISEDDQKIFRSGVGSLLYLMKHSRPVSNAVRELSKVMDGATAGHMKTLFRTVKFVCDTKISD